jgi:hypothetical protein
LQPKDEFLVRQDERVSPDELHRRQFLWHPLAYPGKRRCREPGDPDRLGNLEWRGELRDKTHISLRASAHEYSQWACRYVESAQRRPRCEFRPDHDVLRPEQPHDGVPVRLARPAHLRDAPR